MILYRPVGLDELALIYDSGMKAFPTRLPKQPIFYPVLDLEYARKTASKWNVKNGQHAGYVTEFKVDDEYINKFEKHTVGTSQHQEFWIPAEELETFNRHITGHIKVVEAYFGAAFQGFVPDQFGLQGKNGVEQFTLLSNSYVYKRMEFYLEIKRNHKAVFLNYPFWLTYDFKNTGLKQKVLQAIKEAWFTSFPKIPLANPGHEAATLEKQVDSPSPENVVDEDTDFEEQAEPHSSAEPVDEDVNPVSRTVSPSFAKPVGEKFTPVKRSESISSDEPVQGDLTPVKKMNSPLLRQPVPQVPTPVQPPTPHFAGKPARNDNMPESQTTSPVEQSGQIGLHLVRGIQLGIDGKYHEALDEISKVVEEDRSNVIAHTSLGVVYHRLGEDDRALACYQTALRLDPKHAEAHYFRANILYERGDVRQAIADYTIAVGLAPALIEAHEKTPPQDRLTDYTRTAAEIYRIARSAHQILALNQLLETDRRQADLWKERAAHYYRLWNYEQAIADYSAALKIQPDDANALHARGLAYEQLRQQDRALEDFQRAISINPQLSEVYINRGVNFGKAGNFRQSIDNLSEGIRLAPKNPDGYFNRGITYFNQGDLDGAIDDFSSVIQLSPNDDAAYYWRGISYEEAGRQGDAIADYRQFLERSQDPRARQEIEDRLSSQRNEGKPNSTDSRAVIPEDSQKINQVEPEKPAQSLDVHDLLVALGERALNSTWFGSGVQCYGETAEELSSFTEQNRPIEGRELLRIASGIQQTIGGDFTAFDPDATTGWILIRAWGGSGFYIETNDLKRKEQLKIRFPSVEEVEATYASYEALFIHI